MKPTNSRAAWQHSMPPLKEAFADFKGFAKGEVRVNRIYDLLAIFIQSHRGRVARRFYPTRELAKFFGVSRFPIATVFQRLQDEGLLRLVRGSQTMIPARIPRTRITVRGVVALPIWMPAFFCFIDWRRWCASVQQELARHHFAAEPVFFSAGEDTNLISFVDRILKFNPDYVLWFLPGKADLNAIRGFADAGVPVLTVNRYREHYPARAYPLSDDQAWEQGLKEWRLSGEVDEILVMFGKPGTTVVSESLRFALNNCQLSHRIEIFPGPRSDLSKYLARLMSQSRKGIIFEDNMFYAIACLWEPEAMLKLFRRHRVITERQVFIPGGQTEGITIDALQYHYERLARRIALDLSQAKGGIASRQPIFHAEWRPRTPLEEVSQYNIVE